jgi:preprotein translocase SecF subunit
VVVQKTIFSWLIDKGLLTEMRMPQLFGVPKWSYMGIRLPAIAVSIVFVVLAYFDFQATGDEKYDIEFKSGYRVVIALDEKVGISDAKERVAEQYPEATVVSIKSDRPEAGELNLTLESDSFQITIPAPKGGEEFNERKKEEVNAFIGKAFAKELYPEGRERINSPTPQDRERTYRLNFVKPTTKEAVQSMLDKAGGFTGLDVTMDDDRTATAKLTLEEPEERFYERMDEALDTSELKLTEPIPMKSFVDPKTAERHRDDAIKAVIISLIFQILYIYFRFHGAAYGFAAVIALVHDVFITLGAIALFSHFGLVNVKINLPIIAAILTLIGYSMNDTIVVFDRIRENLPRNRGSLSEVIDLSVNQTMSRSVRTSLTTFLVVLAVFIVNFGAASVLEGFAFVLIVGVITGTYSSIFVASPMLLFLPWHYLRGKRFGLFWMMVGVSVVSLIGLLFSPAGSAMETVWEVLKWTYPAYFLIDLSLWLFMKDPDKALNTVLRAQGVKA